MRQTTHIPDLWSMHVNGKNCDTDAFELSEGQEQDGEEKAVVLEVDVVDDEQSEVEQRCQGNNASTHCARLVLKKPALVRELS